MVLTLADAGLVAEVEGGIEAGEDLDQVFAAYPDRTARIDMGCATPVQHGERLAPVALNGEVGRSYVRESGDGAIFVAKVTRRDEPAP